MTVDPNAPAPTARFGEDKTVLVVEDEHRVRRVTATRLIDLGFRVLEAGDGTAALEMLATHPEIEILYSDVVMPGALSGLDLARRAQELYPDLHIVLTSAYSAELMHETAAGLDFHVLHKPYRQAELARVFRDALQAGAPAAGSARS